MGTQKSGSEVSVMNASKVSKAKFGCNSDSDKENDNQNENRSDSETKISKLRQIKERFKEMHLDELSYTENQAINMYMSKTISYNM